ncbi:MULTISPECIES: hypothetical protein [Nostocales]|uniref:Uncharacterized protein n=3 Tax=Nostocales TaxID=1161 RepID=A0A0C1NC32_9CYAN|nr:hypothetical protein [Tolypothrix bouteillei]KAF3890335.1 hypothetical protein DA73_0400036465 [Tolypothrix bouteillei VB521301]
MLNQKNQIPTETSNFFQKHTIVSSRIFLWSAWIIYIGYLLLSDLPPGLSVLHIQPKTFQEALDLSLNFWFVMPLLSPSTAPVINPALEGLFNIVITWGLLFWGFLVDGRNQRFPMLPFLIGTALLTNVFYLPWLAIRQPNTQPPKDSLNTLEKIAESRAFPLVLTGVVVASLAWAMLARPEFGNLTARWTSLIKILSTDRLAYSFLIDFVVFWIFQSWLVPDDMARRHWQDPTILWIVRFVPFVGLVVFLLRRPSLPIDSEN